MFLAPRNAQLGVPDFAHVKDKGWTLISMLANILMLKTGSVDEVNDICVEFKDSDVKIYGI